MEAVKELQRKIGVLDDGDFGKKSAIAFMNHYKLSASQTAHFLGQCFHETGGFKLFEENLNYSSEGLINVFKSDFDLDKDRVIEANEKLKANTLARKPEPIANFVYANQNGNGNEASGDGWKFRGRGALQTTGRSNYKSLSDYLLKPEIMDNPSLVATQYAFDSALFYFKKRSLWKLCGSVDNSSITKVTRLINGGTNGLADRIKWTNHFYSLLTK